MNKAAIENMLFCKFCPTPVTGRKLYCPTHRDMQHKRSLRTSRLKLKYNTERKPLSKANCKICKQEFFRRSSKQFCIKCR